MSPPETQTSPLSRVAVALDTPDRRDFRRWASFFGPRVGVLKVGLEAFVAWGAAAVEEAAEHGAVFLDLKLHDIPNTVAGAVRAARRLGVSYLTLHAGGGRRMMEAAVEAADGEVELLGVTVLTHLDAAELAELGLPGSAGERVGRWAGLAAEAGCAGIVCSPRELATLRPRHPRPFRLVTPGIRPRRQGGGAADGDAAGDDQRRTATPAEAVRAGSDLLVIGRPLTRADDPEAALERLANELASA